MKTRAVRGEKKNGSGPRQLIVPRLSKPLSSCLSELRWRAWQWKFTGLRLGLEIWWIFFKQDIKRWLFCKRGYHKMFPTYYLIISYRKDKEKRKRVDYLQCRNCPLIFFSTARDKRIYLNLTNSKRSSFAKFPYFCGTKAIQGVKDV